MSTSIEDVEHSPADDVIMEVRDVSVTFGMDRGESRVLDNVSIDIKRNDILGVVGESGSGKSMFASALLDAVVEPGRLTGDITYYSEHGDSTRVLDLSRDELSQFRWEEVAMVFQGAMSSFNPVRDIRTHFRETLKAHDYDIEEGMERTNELLRDLYLDPDRVLDSYPHELSGGMKQRALIALSLVLEPDLLVMDEPTAALDLLMQRSILSLLENIQEEYELTVVFITHDLPLVAGLCDRLAVMYAFEFVEIGSARDLLRSAAHPYARSLLKAVPDLDAPLEQMRPIEGSSPDPVNVPSGCSYHPRCPLADETCRAENPDYFEVSDGHQVACFNWEQSADAIPLEAEETAGESATITGAQSDEPILSLEDVEVHFEQSGGFLDIFSSPTTVQAVDGVGLDIYDNDVVVLVGESGCGKTTLGKAAIAVQRPTGGTVEYRGQDVWDAKEHQGNVDVPFSDIRRALQIIHQDPGSSINPNRTIIASLTEPLTHAYPELDAESSRSYVLGMLKTVGMTPPHDYAQRYPHQLSGGEKQRVALIRALLMNPDLILADEAISALDVSLRVEMMDLLLDLQEQFDTSYLAISHDLANARYFAGKAGGRIGVMYLGEIVEIGPAEEIIRNPKHPYTQVLKWSTASLDPDQETEDPPIRSIDIPDPVDPPSGCRFHTRCPYAREACAQEAPSLQSDDETQEHDVACYRDYDDHPYWDSEPLEGTDDVVSTDTD